jgi:hypothetical protein
VKSEGTIFVSNDMIKRELKIKESGLHVSHLFFFYQEILKSQGQSNGATVQGRALSSIGRGLVCEAGKSGLRCPICFFVKHTKLTHKSPKGQKDRGQTAGNGAEKHLSFRDGCGNYFYLRCRTGRARDTSADGAR